jgi:hypothetical protein
MPSVDFFDFLDLLPIPPSGVPKRAVLDATTEARIALSAALSVSTVINFALVLFTSLASNLTLVFVALPALSGTLVYVLARHFGLAMVWSIALAFCALGASFIGDGGAWLLRIFGLILHDMG